MTIAQGPAADITRHAQTLQDLVPRLSDSLTERTPAPDTSVRRRVLGSKPPWNTPAAHALMAIHATARDLEADLGTYVHGTYSRRIDGSDGATVAALQAIADWVVEHRLPDDELHRVAHKLGELVDQADSVPQLAAHRVGVAMNGGIRCPHCGLRTLASVAGGGIECINTRCENPTTHQRPTWTRAQWPALLRQIEARR